MEKSWHWLQTRFVSSRLEIFYFKIHVRFLNTYKSQSQLSSVNEQSFVIERKFRKWTRNSDLTNEKKSSVLNLLTELLKSERR